MADACMELVRQWDRDRYLATLFAPDDKRSHLFALYAFDAEVARISTMVTEPQIGEIRLQWWIDTLEAIEKGHSVDHPVAQRFATTMKAFALPAEHLGNLLEARRSEYYADQFPNLFSLESYIAETESALMQFAAIILDRPAAAQAAASVGPAGSAFGLARLFARPRLESKYIPDGESLESLRALSRKRLAEARQNPVPKCLLPAVLPATLTESYLDGTPSALKRQWKIWRAARSGCL